jgi:hypothetical protein
MKTVFAWFGGTVLTFALLSLGAWQTREHVQDVLKKRTQLETLGPVTVEKVKKPLDFFNDINPFTSARFEVTGTVEIYGGLRDITLRCVYGPQPVEGQKLVLGVNWLGYLYIKDQIDSGKTIVVE